MCCFLARKVNSKGRRQASSERERNGGEIASLRQRLPFGRTEVQFPPGWFGERDEKSEATGGLIVLAAAGSHFPGGFRPRRIWSKLSPPLVCRVKAFLIIDFDPETGGHLGDFPAGANIERKRGIGGR